MNVISKKKKKSKEEKQSLLVGSLIVSLRNVEEQKYLVKNQDIGKIH